MVYPLAGSVILQHFVLVVHRVVFEEREKRAIDDVYLLRVEQLYPLPLKALVAALSRFKGADIFWCQEEPKNMGAWNFVDRRIERVLAGLDIAAKRPRFVGRAEAASPATGLFRRHSEEQAQLVGAALAA